MSYCSYDNLIDNFGETELIQLTDRDNTGGIGYAVLDAAMARADRHIDSFIVAYLPLDNVPERFADIACDFTRYFLYKDACTDEVNKRFAAGEKYLEGIRDGKYPIGPDSGGAVDAKSADDVAYQTGTVGFGDLSGF